MSADIWSMIAAEREDFSDFLKMLSPGDWEKPSLCTDWKIKEVVAHLVAGAKLTPGKFIVALVSSGFNFNKMNAKGIERELRASSGDFPGELRALAHAKSYPAGAILGEALVHSEDVRTALGKPGNHPKEHLLTLADFYKKVGAPLNYRKRIQGVTLQATDMDWSTGEGPAVRGPMLSLILAMTGRPAGAEGLSGPGLDILKPRLKL